MECVNERANAASGRDQQLTALDAFKGDDIRDNFAHTSMLERYNRRILSAETDRDAIQFLQDTPDIDVVVDEGRRRIVRCGGGLGRPLPTSQHGADDRRALRTEWSLTCVRWKRGTNERLAIEP